MKVLLSCDDVFEALTSGCAAARADEALREHLECCPECQHLAELMEPAVELFADELRVGGLRRCDATMVVNGVLARLEAERSATLVESHRRSFLSLAPQAWSQLGAAAAILLALGGLFWAVGPRDGSVRAEQALLPPFSLPLARASVPEAHGLLHLASLRLPEPCLTPEAAQQASHSRQCCTRCHQVGDYLPAQRIVAFSQTTCTACHRS